MAAKVSDRVGSYFRKKRVESGMTQIELSKRLGYSTSQFVSNWERGVCMPPLSNMASLCDLLSIPKREIVDLLTDEYRRNLERAVKLKRAG